MIDAEIRMAARRALHDPAAEAAAARAAVRAMPWGAFREAWALAARLAADPSHQPRVDFHALSVEDSAVWYRHAETVETRLRRLRSLQAVAARAEEARVAEEARAAAAPWSPGWLAAPEADWTTSGPVGPGLVGPGLVYARLRLPLATALATAAVATRHGTGWLNPASTTVEAAVLDAERRGYAATPSGMLPSLWERVPAVLLNRRPAGYRAGWGTSWVWIAGRPGPDGLWSVELGERGGPDGQGRAPGEAAQARAGVPAATPGGEET